MTWYRIKNVLLPMHVMFWSGISSFVSVFDLIILHEAKVIKHHAHVSLVLWRHDTP